MRIGKLPYLLFGLSLHVLTQKRCRSPANHAPLVLKTDSRDLVVNETQPYRDHVPAQRIREPLLHAKFRPQPVVARMIIMRHNPFGVKRVGHTTIIPHACRRVKIAFLLLFEQYINPFCAAPPYQLCWYRDVPICEYSKRESPDNPHSILLRVRYSILEILKHWLP